MGIIIRQKTLTGGTSPIRNLEQSTFVGRECVSMIPGNSAPHARIDIVSAVLAASG